MNEQVLSIEQMHYLKKLGIDISNASMCQCYINADKYMLMISDENIDYLDVPVFTLQDIINILPEEIKNDKKCYDLIIGKDCIKYCLDGSDIHEFKNMLHYEYDEKLITSAYRMLVWLFENDFINKN